MAKSIFPGSWAKLLDPELDRPYFQKLLSFLDKETKQHKIAPAGNFFKALQMVDYKDVKVVILGQDPYPTKGHANGLAFAVNKGVETPKSLQNIFKELSTDLKVDLPTDNTLLGWAEQGVLLLNTVLTCRIGEPMSHRNQGWEILTDRIIQILNERPEPILFILWGKPAESKRRLISNPKHKVLIAAHPSPLAAYRGFLGCKHFSKSQKILQEMGYEPVDWTKTGKQDE
jgi:uracil-DNA glycosylase